MKRSKNLTNDSRNKPKNSVRILASCLGGWLALAPAVVSAEWKPPKVRPIPIECSPGWPTRCNAALNAGDRSPMTGVVMSPDLAIYLGQSTEVCQERIDAAVTATSAIAKEDKKQMRREFAADLRVVEVERNLYKNAVERPLLEHPIVVASITVVTLVGLFFAANAVVKAARAIQE